MKSSTEESCSLARILARQIGEQLALTIPAFAMDSLFIIFIFEQVDITNALLLGSYIPGTRVLAYLDAASYAALGWPRV